MKTGASLFDTSRFTVAPTRGSERGELLDKFLERLNPAMVAKGYRPYTHARLSAKLAHIPTEQLYPFFKDCERAGIPFGAYFHWSLKPKNEEVNK